MRFSTLETPGADQAARAASSFSASERTVPCRVTLPPSTSTVMRLASSSADRLNASSILALSSVGATLGLTVIRLLTPITPVRKRTARSASSRWNPHSTSPSSLTQPLLTVTLILSFGKEKLGLRR